MSKLSVSLLALACVFAPLAANAQSQGADEARRQSMMSEMRTDAYNADQRNNTPAPSAYHSTVDTGSGRGTHGETEPLLITKPLRVQARRSAQRRRDL